LSALKVLAINTFAGSILQGASDFGADIIGSYEDKGYMQPVAQANFPNVEHIGKRKDWPDRDLSETIVVAHPPCSAFSVQTTSKSAKGIDAAAFFCTTQVLEYALKNKALAVCVESVIGALPGAWVVHEKFAREHGYHCYRLLENGCMFGAQWRERFWAVWIRKGAGNEGQSDDWSISLTPKFQVVEDVLTGHEDGPSPPGLDLALTRLKEKLTGELKLTNDQMEFLFDPREHKTTWIIEVLYENFFKHPTHPLTEDKWYLHQDIGGFSTSVMKYLDPRGTAPVLLADSFWYYNGRVLSEAGYKRLMGFPSDYKFPIVDRKDYRNTMRQCLSKGVMPPIVTWLLDQLGAHLGMHEKKYESNRPSYQLTCRPEHIVDFRIRKEDWSDRYDFLPELRHYDDERETKAQKRRVVA
jgi:site-specific DNA-cytosine methylase